MGNEGFLGGADEKQFSGFPVERCILFDSAFNNMELQQDSIMEQIRLQMLFLMKKVQFDHIFTEVISIKLILVSIILLLHNFQEKMTTTYPSNIHPKRCLNTGHKNRILKKSFQ
ncbi:hypothetical protein TNIN_159431 [Trichonephila inaurata madagascariensis]|uniref:Uncharacterized protein n=1 Tax=Trichonephila inaurata madagascariensis TaxID=2747483 RepID=A0A8X7BW53_9ARAC|nr:hypothetical protein TNIN_159431 [Trichonephila inaurata madagascariensis]